MGPTPSHTVLGAQTGGQRPHRSKRRRMTKIDTDLLELTDTRIHEPQRVAASRNGMVSTAPLLGHRRRSSDASAGRQRG